MAIVLKKDAARMARMQSICKNYLDSGSIDEIIIGLQHEKGLKEWEKMWIIYKVSQVQTGRNIIAIAQDGLRVMGIDA